MWELGTIRAGQWNSSIVCRGPFGRAGGVWWCNQGRERTAVGPAVGEAVVMGRQGGMGMGMAKGKADDDHQWTGLDDGSREQRT
jgi:hypothetical protein